jgi:AraC-like DNA-binding protein
MIAQTRRPEVVYVSSTREISIGRQTTVTARIVEYIENNYAAPISLRDVAENFGYSPSYLTHKFCRSTGLPINAWIIMRRIRAAQQRLGEQNADVATVSEAVGFNDVCYFTRQFVRHVGVTPGRFRTSLNISR